MLFPFMFDCVFGGGTVWSLTHGVPSPIYLTPSLAITWMGDRR